MLMNAVTIAAIVAACWAHPSGVAYLEKIEQIRVCAEAKGNPCCKEDTRQGGPDRQHVERITKPANWAPKHEFDLDLPESPYARPDPVVTTVPGVVPTSPPPKVVTAAKPVTVAPQNPAAAPLSEQDALAMVLAALFVLDDD